MGHSGKKSERLDLNQRPPRPKRGALTRLSYAPHFWANLQQISQDFKKL